MAIEGNMKFGISRDVLDIFLCLSSLVMYGLIAWFWPLHDVSFIPYAINSFKEFDFAGALPYIGVLVLIDFLIKFNSYFKIKNLTAPANVNGNYLGLGGSVIDPQVKLSKWLTLKSLSNFNWRNYLFMLIFGIMLGCTKFTIYFNLVLLIEKLADTGTNVAVAIALPIMILLWGITRVVFFNKEKSLVDTQSLNRINIVKVPIYYALLGQLIIYNTASVIPVIVTSVLIELLLFTPIYHLLISRHAFAKNEPLSLSLAYRALKAHKDHCKDDYITIEE